MAAINWLVLLLTHPLEFRTLLQFYLYHEQKRDIKAITEHPTSGWDRDTMKRCWYFLDQTSRSFAAVIKELDGDLARTVRIRLIGRCPTCFQSARPRHEAQCGLLTEPSDRSVSSTSCSEGSTP